MPVALHVVSATLRAPRRSIDQGEAGDRSIDPAVPGGRDCRGLPPADPIGFCNLALSAGAMGS
jgi:hypothetical protein